MKNLILVILTLLSFPAFAQGWKTVKLDTAVSFKLPPEFQKAKSDTASSFSASTTFGTILIFKASDNPVVTPDIERDKHLAEYYDDYIERVRTSTSDGKITNEKDTVIGDLSVKDFTLEIDTGQGMQIRKFRILHANNATYTFEFLFDELHREYADDECNRFFNSIMVNENVERSDQFNAPETITGSLNPYLVSGGVLLVIGLIIYLVIRKRRVVS